MAHWIIYSKGSTGGDVYKCSNCGGTWDSNAFPNIYKMNLCPNCGKDIDEGSEIYEYEDYEKMTKTAEETQRLADKLKKKNMIEGPYQKYLSDIVAYLRAKFPEAGEENIWEAAGFISHRTMTVVGDLMLERDRGWKKEIDKLEKYYEGAIKKGMKGMLPVKREEEATNEEI